MICVHRSLSVDEGGFVEEIQSVYERVYHPSSFEKRLHLPTTIVMLSDEWI